MTQSGQSGSSTQVFEGSSVVDPWLAMRYAELLEMSNPLYRDIEAAAAAGHDNVLVPETQLFLACRATEQGEAPRSATGLPEGYNAVVTGIRAEYLRPVVAGTPFTVRVSRVDSGLKPTARVRAFHVVMYELVDDGGEVAVRNWLTVAEFN